MKALTAEEAATIAGQFRAAADLLDATPDPDVNRILRDVTGDSPRAYSVLWREFAGATDSSGLGPIEYGGQYGPALLAHRMREVADGLTKED